MSVAYLVPTVDGVAYGLLLFVVASGLTLAFGAGGVLNLAHGSLFALGAYASATLTDGSWGSLAAAVVAGTLAGAAAGGLLALGLAPLTRRGHLRQALFTFGVALVVGSLLVLVFGSEQLRPAMPPVLDQPVELAGVRYPGYRLAFIAVAVLLASGGWWVLARTRWGAVVRAMRDDQAMLASVGTSPRVVLAGVMAAGGGLAALAGVLGAPILGAGPGTGELVLLLSLIVVVVGGVGSIGGALLAAVAVGQVQTLGVVLLPDLTPYLLFAAMAAALLLRRRLTPVPSAAADNHDPLGPGLRVRGASWWRLTRGWPVPVLVVLAAAPWVVDGYTLHTTARIMAIGLLAVSVAVLTGVAGLPTLGQVAPYAVGAYTAGLLGVAGYTTGPLQLALAAAAAGVLALVVGLAVVRTRMVVCLMVTLAVGVLTATVADQWRGVTGGSDGLFGIPAAAVWPGGPLLVEDRIVYWYVLAVATAAVAATAALLRSRAGMLLRGARDNETRMRASGHPVGGYLLTAHVAAGTLAGLGGALLVTTQRYVSPADVGFTIAALVLLAVLVGGAGSIWGALAAAALVVTVRDWAAAGVPGHGPLVLGGLFIAAVYLLPHGAAGTLTGVLGRLATAVRRHPTRAGSEVTP